MTFVPAIDDDVSMSRVWPIGVAGAVALLTATWIWRMWRPVHQAPADFGNISDAWINHHHARNHDHDPAR
jgi:ABC-type nickel/cobalt efflux system permease component RcnA